MHKPNGLFLILVHTLIHPVYPLAIRGCDNDKDLMTYYPCGNSTMYKYWTTIDVLHFHKLEDKCVAVESLSSEKRRPWLGAWNVCLGYESYLALLDKTFNKALFNSGLYSGNACYWIARKTFHGVPTWITTSIDNSTIKDIGRDVKCTALCSREYRDFDCSEKLNYICMRDASSYFMHTKLTVTPQLTSRKYYLVNELVRFHCTSRSRQGVEIIIKKRSPREYIKIKEEKGHTPEAWSTFKIKNFKAREPHWSFYAGRCYKHYTKEMDINMSMALNYSNIICCEDESRFCVRSYITVKDKLICPERHYGTKCEKVCNCLHEEECKHLVKTGKCPGFCMDGYEGEDCLSTCGDLRFGRSCAQLCSSHCKNKVCNKTDGSCLHGCKDGYTSDTCSESCPVGKYGTGCKKNCSEFCQQRICHPVTGSCGHGCQKGRIGASCTLSATWVARQRSSSAITFVVIATLAVLGIAFLCTMLSERAKKFHGGELE